MTPGSGRQKRYIDRLRAAAAGSRRANPRRRNVLAIERTIAALRRAGRLEDVDAAFVAAARTSAEALDRAETPYITATVARAHLEVVARLLDRPGAAPDPLDLFLAGLREPASGS